MITAAEFLQRWNRYCDSVDPLIREECRRFVKPSAAALNSLTLAGAEKDFLQSVGLPESTSPFLGFEDVKELPKLTAVYPHLTEKPPVGLLQKLRGRILSRTSSSPAQFDRYRIIGSDGAGNPLCIDEQDDGRVVWLEHEDNFRPNYLSTSVSQLAESLLLFAETGKKRPARDAKRDRAAMKKIESEFLASMKECDPEALERGSFWQDNISMILET
jgi:hypothetical protein